MKAAFVVLTLDSASAFAVSHLRVRSHLRCPTPVAGILKGIDPLLTAELLYALRSAGHGDVIAVVDANFPAASTAIGCVMDEPIVLAGADCVEGITAIGSVLPLDRFVEAPVGKMVPSLGSTLPPLGVEVHEKVIAALGGWTQIGVQAIERFDFYEMAKDAYCIVQCSGERRPYGCFLLTKGVLGPDGNDLMP